MKPYSVSEFFNLLDLLTRKPRVYRVPLHTVKAGRPFTYRGITYLKSANSNEAFRITNGKSRIMAPDANVRPLVCFEYGQSVNGFDAITR